MTSIRKSVKSIKGVYIMNKQEDILTKLTDEEKSKGHILPLLPLPNAKENTFFVNFFCLFAKFDRFRTKNMIRCRW